MDLSLLWLILLLSNLMKMYNNLQIDNEELEGPCAFSFQEDMPVPTPIMLTFRMGKKPKILYPEKDGYIRLDRREQFRLVCKGTKFAHKSIKTSDIMAECYNKNKVRLINYNDMIISFKRLKCMKYPLSDTRIRGKGCFNSDPETVNIDVGFRIDDIFIKQYRVCFNYKTRTNIFSWYNTSMLIHGYQRNSQRVFFKPDHYDYNIQSKFNWKNAVPLLAKILKSDRLARTYMNPPKNRLLARGHLTPKADFVYGYQQAATMYYINVAPQWQPFNGGNWERLESAIRTLLRSKTGKLYKIATGVQGNATLPDCNGDEQELYLHDDKVKNRKLIVPKYFWKIVYHKFSNVGIAFVGVNIPHNPIVSYHREKNFCEVCNSICNDLDWLNLHIKHNSFEYGRLYCCDMKDFLKTFGKVDFVEI